MTTKEYIDKMNAITFTRVHQQNMHEKMGVFGVLRFAVFENIIQNKKSTLIIF